MVFVAEDRLYAAMPFIMVMLPTCMLIYGWPVERASRGLVVPVVFMFLQGIAQLFCYPLLNTYCLDVRPEGVFFLGRHTLRVNDSQCVTNKSRLSSYGLCWRSSSF
jgi:hypothetical protein